MSKYKKVNLINGAKLYFRKNDINSSTIIRVKFPSGAREDGKKPGLAHLTEHMIFTGTPKHTKEELSKINASFGYSNAETNAMNIRFVGEFLPKQLKDYLEYLSEMLTQSLLTKKLLEEEKKIVLQEFKGRTDDHKFLNYHFNNCKLCPLDVYINTVIGKEEAVKSITTSEVRKFIKSYFVANNCTVFLCAPISLNKAKKMLNNLLIKNLPINKNLPKLDKFYFEAQNQKFFQNKFVDINKCYTTINMVYDKPWNDFDFYNKFSLVMYALNMEGYGLHKLLRLDNKLVYFAGAASSIAKNNGMIFFEAESSKDNVNAIITKLGEWIKTFAQNGIDQKTLDVIKDKHKFNIATQIPSPFRYMGKLEAYELKQILENSKKLFKDKMNLTLDELNAMIKEVFSSARFSCSVYGDIKKDALISEKQFNKLYN